VNILVTGGAGFIGSHVVDAFVSEGHNVFVVDDLSTGSMDNLNPKAEFFHLDIRNKQVEEVFRRVPIDVIDHHAAQMDVRRSVADPQFDAGVNVIGGLNLFEAARTFGVKKIIFSSTGGAIYGEQERFPADEEHPLKPLSPYGITKLVTEKYLFYYKAVHDIDHVILRYANVYGPRQNPLGEAGVVAIFAKKMLEGQTPVINGDGTQTRDYVFVEDVVRCNLLALRYKGSNIFNIGTGIETDVNRLYQELRQWLVPQCTAAHGPAKQGEQLRSVISNQKAREILGWKPEVALSDGLRLTAAYFKGHYGKGLHG
jgi:UDP-glucose 4-epimerase